MQIVRNKVTTQQVQIAGVILFILFFLASLTKIKYFAMDETLFHFPNMMNFYENGFHAIFNAHYSAANTPLPYLIVATFARLFAPTLLIARIVTGITSIFSFLLSINLLKRLGTSKYCFFVILFFPNFFVNSFVFYAVNYGLFFAMLALIYLYKAGDDMSPRSYFILGILLSLAVLCQQFYLLLPVAIMLPKFIQAFTVEAESRWLYLKNFFISGLSLMLPMIVPFVLFLKWGGLTHANFKVHSLAFSPSTIVAILFVTGFYCIPFVVQKFKQIRVMEMVASATFAIIAVLLFRPEFNNYQGPGLFTGFTFHLIVFAGHLNPVVSTISMIILTGLGILVFIKLFTSLESEFEYVLFFSCILLIIAYALNTQIGERHLLPLNMLLFLLILPQIRKPYSRIFPAYISILGVVYFCYWYFIKFS